LGHEGRPPVLVHSFPTRRSSDLTFWNRSRSMSKRNRPRFCQPSNRETNFHLSSRWIKGGSGRKVIGRTFRIHSPYSFPTDSSTRSEEHTSELQSRGHLVCRLLHE